jgi:hypothetical protein
MKALLILFLAISIGVNVYQYFECQETQQPPVITCYVTEGFGDSRQINKDEATRYEERYKFLTARIDTIKSGGIITRKALDELFCSQDCNALAYSLGVDESGTIAADSCAFITITGANVTYDETGKPVIKNLSLPYYLPNLWCPPQCIP